MSYCAIRHRSRGRGGERGKGPVINYEEEGRLQHGRGGGSEVLPLRKRGKAEKVLVILKWGRNKFPPIKKRAHNVLTYLEGRGGGGRRESFVPVISSFS